MATDVMERRRFDRQFEAIRGLAPEKLVPAGERHRHDVRGLVAGAYFRWEGRVYRVESLATYQEADEAYARTVGEPWVELALFCVDTGETAYLEWEEDDAVEVHATSREVPMRELRDDAGARLDPDDLDTIVDEEASAFHDGREYEYDDDYAALFRRDGEGDGERVYVYEFVARDGACLTIEEWADPAGGGRHDYQAWLSRRVEPDAIEILATGD